MRELIPDIQKGLGPERLAQLKRDEDAFQDFWEGVFNAVDNVDWDRDFVAYLISAGYGQIRNARRSERTAHTLKYCPKCGRVYGYRKIECPKCKVETVSNSRHMSYIESQSSPYHDVDIQIDIDRFVDILSGQEYYVAKRWMIDRADLLYKNHLTQLAAEMHVSAPRVAHVKNKVKAKFLSFINGAAPKGH